MGTDLPAISGTHPLELVAAWPGDMALAALTSCAAGQRRSRKSILSVPRGVEMRSPDAAGESLAWLRERLAAERGGGGGWVVALGYELGGSIEPSAGRGEAAMECDEFWPWEVVVWRCPWFLEHDSETGRWVVRGEDKGEARRVLAGLEPAREARLRDVRARGTRQEFEQAVERAREFIRAGDIFQANITHAMQGRADGSARRLFASLGRAAEAWYGAYLEVNEAAWRHVVLSASPELFLEFDATTRTVTSRPIKGTRKCETELRESGKDQAELHMIVDLMRNDLGRVAEVGSVRVEEARAMERHGGTSAASALVHGVATVSARVREGLDVCDVLRATFPAGSITGAPKIRAMQIIRELEGRARGLYTGAIGFVSDAGDYVFNVAIRTAVARSMRAGARAGSGAEEPRDQLTDAPLRFGVGGGIVWDSVAAAEWQESVDKAGVLMRVAEREMGV